MNENETGIKTETAGAKEENSFTGVLFDAVSVVITSILIITVVFTFCFRLVGVNGDSMVDTLHNGEWLLVTPYYGSPKYGDIVISTKPVKGVNGSLVKRVIAVGGEEIYMESDGSVYVNGEKKECAYAHYERPYAPVPTGYFAMPRTVPEDCVALMGDNRQNSRDSRYYGEDEVGFPEEEYLLGKAMLRLSGDWNIYKNFNE